MASVSRPEAGHGHKVHSKSKSSCIFNFPRVDCSETCHLCNVEKQNQVLIHIIRVGAVASLYRTVEVVLGLVTRMLAYDVQLRGFQSLSGVVIVASANLDPNGAVMDGEIRSTACVKGVYKQARFLESKHHRVRSSAFILYCHSLSVYVP